MDTILILNIIMVNFHYINGNKIIWDRMFASYLNAVNRSYYHHIRNGNILQHGLFLYTCS